MGLRIDIVTIFPEYFGSPLGVSLIGLPKYSGKIVTMSMRSPTPSPLYYPERAGFA